MPWPPTPLGSAPIFQLPSSSMPPLTSSPFCRRTSGHLLRWQHLDARHRCRDTPLTSSSASSTTPGSSPSSAVAEIFGR
uniref:Uncharacterized protein n=1 Tax=Arundo donax TaxID=35708 RepID=A0A0A9AL85_ARUDO